MAEMRAFTPIETSSLTKRLWDDVRKEVAPDIWKWYDDHKDVTVTKLFGMFTITYGSFGILASGLTAIFGPRPS